MTTIRVKTDPLWAWMTNRNAHCISLKEVTLWTMYGKDVIHLDGVSKAGRDLTGGLSLDRAAWENLILEYIKQEADGKFWVKIYKLVRPQQPIKGDQVRTWLISTLESWLHTWDEIEDPRPKMLPKIISSLRKNFTKFTSEAYEEILFHLWQIYGQEEE